MNKCACFFTSTLGKKVTMAVTGLLLIGFLVVHLIGNLSLFPAFGGKEKFNDYAHLLSSTPLIYGAEALLLAIFLIHIVAAIQVSLRNKAARPVAYEVRNTFGKSNAYSRGMLHTGLTVLVFLVVHLVTFKFGKEYPVSGTHSTEVAALNAEGKMEMKSVEVLNAGSAEDMGKRDLYRTVTELFACPAYSAFYIVAMLVMGLHLMHAFKSACQTLGLFHAKWNNLFARISVGLAFFFAVGYSSFPIYFGFIKPEKACGMNCGSSCNPCGSKKDDDCPCCSGKTDINLPAGAQLPEAPKAPAIPTTPSAVTK